MRRRRQSSLDFPHTTRQVWNEDLWIFICRQDHTKGRRSEEGSFEVSLTSICLAHCFQPDSWANGCPAALADLSGEVRNMSTALKEKACMLSFGNNQLNIFVLADNELATAKAGEKVKRFQKQIKGE